MNWRHYFGVAASIRAAALLVHNSSCNASSVVDVGGTALIERLQQLAPVNMIWIPGGSVHMGSDENIRKRHRSHRVAVSGFWIECKPVTNRQFFSSSSAPPATRPSSKFHIPASDGQAKDLTCPTF